jgi:hypothetical protein
MIGRNWKEPRKTTIFDIIDCVYDKISFVVQEIRFRFKPKQKQVITLTSHPTMYCPIDDMHPFRYERSDTYYCTKCGKHYLYNEMVKK